MNAKFVRYDIKIHIISLFVTADVQTIQVCFMCSELIHIKFFLSVLDNLLALKSQTSS